MAWKRGTQNNQAGEIRKGQIKEFLLPTYRELSVSFRLKIIDISTTFQNLLNNDFSAYTNFEYLPNEIQPFIQPETNILHLHAHEHPASVVNCKSSNLVPKGCIALSESHRINSKVCIGENELWTVYQGEVYAYDIREVSIGDKKIRIGGKPEPLSQLILDLKLFSFNNSNDEKISNTIHINAQILRPQILKYLLWSIVTVDESYPYLLNESMNQSQSISDLVHLSQNLNIILSVVKVDLQKFDDINQGEDDNYECIDTDLTLEKVDNENLTAKLSRNMENLQDSYRGLVTSDTVIYLQVDKQFQSIIYLENNPSIPPSPLMKNIVYILTNDNECFPVQRKLLRPCLALTVLVQAGRGKYANSSVMENQHVELYGTEDNPYFIDVDACAFDRVLLYLEHEARNEPFRFDPLIVSELRDAGVKLKVLGLVNDCDRVLGSFQERVRKNPIRLQEVITRNNAGITKDSNGITKRSETLLILSGMVLDISRWIDEHPGGSAIIPNQALNMDCSVFFEIYHSSRQSFLYLKEFYIGELAEEDLPLVLKPALSCDQNNEPSLAFQEQLRKVTSWRLKPEDYQKPVYKSF
jgi:hypothetical protein